MPVKSESKPRPRGLRSDGEATRTRILEAAGELFAAHGFAETTGKAIASRADVDLASINYHFGSRDGLYQAVLVQAHHRLVNLADLQQLARSTLPAAEKLKMLIGQLVRNTTNEAESWHLTVLAAELLAPSSHVQVLLQSEAPMKVSLVISILSEITGIPAQDPALLPCLLNIVAPGLLLLLTSKRGLPGPREEIRQLPSEMLIEHLFRFAIAGLEAAGRDYAGQSTKNRESPSLS
ncbi:MAG: TetR/AcrR family transcriptional regulator [Pseudoxanthomonas sp.]